MNRQEWNAIYRGLRVNASPKTGAANCTTIMHGGTYWTIRVVRPQGLIVYPSIIRDRAPCARIDDWLRAARDFRIEASKAYDAYRKVSAIKAARACIEDAREISLSASIFHAIAA